MTARECIEALKAFPPDAEVVLAPCRAGKGEARLAALPVLRTMRPADEAPGVFLDGLFGEKPARLVVLLAAEGG